MSDSSRSIVIVGAGIVGICCARWLQRDGHRVRVIDRVAPGQSCSWGNAGVFATDCVVPLANPHSLRVIPRELLDRHSGVHMHWPSLPWLLPWLVRFVASGRQERMRRSMATLSMLLSRAESGLLPLIEGGPAEALFRRTGWVTAFETTTAFDAARWEFDQRRGQGIAWAAVDGNGLRAWVPQLAAHVVGGFHVPGTATITDPGGLVACLADDVIAAGGRIDLGAVQRLEPTAGRVRVITPEGAVDADHVVVATGAWTSGLARSLGDHFPLAVERGCHAMIAEPGIETPMPVMSGEHRFVATTMRQGLRLAGTTELGGLDRPLDPRRVRAMVVTGRRLLPELRADDWGEWLGFRPTLPDSLPVIGRSPSTANVSYVFGHQHLGLTLAGISGRLIADQLAGRPPAPELAALRADRFRLRPAPASPVSGG